MSIKFVYAPSMRTSFGNSPPGKRPVKNIINNRSSGFEKHSIQNRFKNYFALTFALSFEMREADRFLSWGAMRF